MSTFPNGPKTQRAAIYAINEDETIARVAVFQYNPEKLTRSLEVPNAGGDGGNAEPLRLKGAPVETIKLDAEIDATDQLEQAEENALQYGIYPQLSALEMLLYPESSAVIKNAKGLDDGLIEVIPPAGPLTLFVWGEQRMLPVRLTEFSITEEAFDARLNPIRATVSLGMRVLSYNDFIADSTGFNHFLTHHQKKENLAQIF